MLLHEYLQLSARPFPDKVALVSGSQRITYWAIASSANASASYLLMAGLRKRDTVAVYFVPRMDDVFKCRERVDPVEIEDVIYKMDRVPEARVISVPDKVLGRAVKAKIVLK